MRFTDLNFRDYYHQYLVIEADGLTEKLKPSIPIGTQDCFVLCSSYIDRSGALTFNVLSVGSSWKSCRRGLCRQFMLGSYRPEELLDLQVQLIQPDLQMASKNTSWCRQAEQWTDGELMATRQERRLDEVRDNFYPDCVRVGLLANQQIREYDMRVAGFNGPFVEGRLIGHGQELVRALPYDAGGSIRLLGVFVGEHLSRSQKRQLADLIHRGNEAGFGFSSGRRWN